MRTFNRIKKQVDDRVQHRRPRANLHVMVHDLIVYCLELKTFHVKHWGSPVGDEQLPEDVKDILAAGEALEERCKQWLAGTQS